MSNDILIRKATEFDAESMEAINLQMLAENYPLYWWSAMLHGVNQNYSFVAVAPGNKIIGYVLGLDIQDGYSIGMCMNNMRLIASLAVKSEYQKQGIGRRLLLSSLCAFRSAKLLPVHLHVRVSNKEAISLYQKCFFKKTSTLSKYYENDEDAYLMALTK